jgi:hypothetical protein
MIGNNPHDLSSFIFFSAQYVISFRETKSFEITRGRTQNSRWTVGMDLKSRQLQPFTFKVYARGLIRDILI